MVLTATVGAGGQNDDSDGGSPSVSIAAMARTVSAEGGHHGTEAGGGAGYSGGGGYNCECDGGSGGSGGQGERQTCKRCSTMYSTLQEP